MLAATPHPRLLPTALVLALLTGSAVSFAVTESLKLQKRPITPTQITKEFSPLCRCPQAQANIDFRLLRRDTVTLTIVDATGREVRSLANRRRLNSGPHHFTWNGKDQSGKRLLAGSYRPRVAFADIHRTFLLPNPIHIDVVAPHVRAVSVRPRVFSPDGDGRNDAVVIRYRVSEHAHVLLLANGLQRVRTRFGPLQGAINWNGTAHGRKLPPQTYRVALVAIDLAGNRSAPAPAGTVRLRYLALPPTPLHAVKGATILVPVDTDANVVRWTIWRGSSTVGRGKGGTPLSVRAPKRPGRYVLVLQASGHRLRADLIVRG